MLSASEGSPPDQRLCPVHYWGQSPQTPIIGSQTGNVPVLLPLDVLKLRIFQLQGGCFGLCLPEQGLCPLTPLWALQEPTGSTCSHHHVLGELFTVTTALYHPSYSYNMKIKKLQYHNHTH